LDAQATLVVEDLEAAPARPADVVVDHELVDELLEERQVPAPSAHALDLFRSEGDPPPSEPDVLTTPFAPPTPFARLRRPEAALDAIGVVAARVHPEDDARRRVEELTAGDDLITLTRDELTDPMVGPQRRRTQYDDDPQTRPWP
jgi:hypothetical protein